MFTIIVCAAVIAAVIIFGVICYVKAPPSTALIISGLGNTPRTLIGQGGICVPILERADRLFLGQISVPIRTETSVPTIQ